MAHPVVIAASLALLWRPPSPASVEVFARHNKAAADELVRGGVAKFNACLDDCGTQRCTRFNSRTGMCDKMEPTCGTAKYVTNGKNDGSCWAVDRQALWLRSDREASYERYMACAPRECVEGMGGRTFGVPDTGRNTLVANGIRRVGGNEIEQAVRESKQTRNLPWGERREVILDMREHVEFEGTRLVARNGTEYKEWEGSQAVANVVTACTEFGGYDNVSRAMYDWGYMPVRDGTRFGLGLQVPAVVHTRYPRAAEIMATAAALRGKKNLCRVF